MDQQADPQKNKKNKTTTTKNRKSNRIRQNNKGVDSKVESNDSPEIPYKRGDIRHPRPPSRGSGERDPMTAQVSQRGPSFLPVLHLTAGG